MIGGDAFFLAIFFALAIGFFLGKFPYSRIKKIRENSRFSKKKYVLSRLKTFFDTEDDTALDSFIDEMEVSNTSLEIHLLLGRMLRGIGEFDRAFKVHQNLLSSESVDANIMPGLQLELAKDYVSSGLLDRADTLLNEILSDKNTSKTVRNESLEKLLEVYQDSREWLAAIDVADQLTEKKFAETPDYWRQVQAHFCCELAESLVSQNNNADGLHWIRSAKQYDPNCARANILQARLEIADQKYLAALAALKNVSVEPGGFASETIVLLVQCYEELHNPAALIHDLQTYLDVNTDLDALKRLYEAMIATESYRNVVNTLSKYIANYPNMEPAVELLSVIKKDLNNETFDFYRFEAVLERFLEKKTQYRCRSCGFAGMQLHWHCPSCRVWGSIAMESQESFAIG